MCYSYCQGLSIELNEFSRMQIMFEVTKNLFANGLVKNTRFDTKAIINNIPKKLKILRSYQLQFNQLGYIVSSGGIHESSDHKQAKKTIYDMINGQINRLDQNYYDDKKYRNARSLVYRYVMNPTQVHKYRNLNSELLAAMTHDIEGNKNPHTVIAHRLFKQNKAEGLFAELEKIRDEMDLEASYG